MRIAYLGSVLLLFASAIAPAAESDAPDYSAQIAPLFRKYCNGCHNAEDAEGRLVMEDFGRLMRGGEHGPAVVPGKGDKSRLILVLEKKAEPAMPPEGNEGPTIEEIALLKRWIDAGAKGPDGAEPRMAILVTPRIPPKGPVRRPISALAWSPDGRWLAAARSSEVEILSAADRKPVATLGGHTGQVNDIGFSKDGLLLFAAAGENGLLGEVRLWNTTDGTLKSTWNGHRDSIYAARLSPDGTLLATGSYDKQIKLWNLADGEELRTLSGHNDAVLGLAFHPKGKWLASASGDRTVKLWSVATGERLDTFSEPAKDQYTVAFSPDGRSVVAGGVDNKIRVWRMGATGKEGTNPILYSRFAHEAPILKLVFSPDGRWLVSSSEDRTLKVWETESFTQIALLERQPDWAAALAVSPDSKQLAVGRMNGDLAVYSLAHLGETTAVAASPLGEGLDGSVLATESPMREISEAEPNDQPDTATALMLPATVTGRIHSPRESEPDQDLYRFEARAGETWMIEVNAARGKSPLDSKVEVLHADGTPVPRAKLQAVRDSWINFRGIDSTSPDVRVEYWQEMDLNQYLYMNGEITKTFRMPQGPDSGFQLYINQGKRLCYFDTSAMTHAKDEPVYIIEPYPPNATLVDNGLPVFPLYYLNDDDGERELGADSRLTFTAPADGSYLVRVTDVRGFGGENYHYTLAVRPPKPDFAVTIQGKNAKVPSGSGQRLQFVLDRKDNFQDEVRIEITGLPEGFQIATPTVVQAGHLEARGVITAAADAKAPADDVWKQVKVTATAVINDQTVTKELGDLGTIKLEPKPKVLVRLVPDDPSVTDADGGLVLPPGASITAKVVIERNGFDGELKFDVDNLPHGVIVDNLGLNGIMVRQGETERQIFLTAEKWVPETTRWIHAVAQGQGNQASPPIRLHIRGDGKGKLAAFKEATD